MDGGRTRKTGLVERADGAQDLFHARTETTYPRRTIFLAKKKRESVSIDRRKQSLRGDPDEGDAPAVLFSRAVWHPRVRGGRGRLDENEDR